MQAVSLTQQQTNILFSFVKKVTSLNKNSRKSTVIFKVLWGKNILLYQRFLKIALQPFERSYVLTIYCRSLW